MESPLASAILEQLQPLFVEPDFDTLFNRLTEGESKSARLYTGNILNSVKHSAAVVLSTMNSWKWLRKWRMKERFSLSVRRIL
jgi:glutamine synthetase